MAQTLWFSVNSFDYYWTFISRAIKGGFGKSLRWKRSNLGPYGNQVARS